jgi:integrative and conjugative element protein (TIGR02256 family)
VRDERRVAWVPNFVMRMMAEHAETSAPLETGGVIIGYWVTVGVEAVITAATGPGPSACHFPERFEPDTTYHRAEIAREYEESGRLHVYLGDWHTHPRNPPIPSKLDRNTLRFIARAPRARMPVPLMGIVGQGASQFHGRWSLAIWRHVPLRDRFRSRLAPVMSLRIQPYGD